MSNVSTVLGTVKSEHSEPKQDRGLLDSLYAKYWQGLCRYLNVKFGAAPPEAADVAQTAFAKFAAIKEVTAVENPKAFLYATARHEVIDQQRRAQTHNSYAQASLVAAQEEILDGMTPERVLVAKETLHIIREAIRRLPRKQRRVLLLHRLHDHSFSEISRLTGWSKSDVRRQVCQAIATIEKALERVGR